MVFGIFLINVKKETQVQRLGLQAWMREPRSRDPGGDTRREIGFTSLEERPKEQRPWMREPRSRHPE